MIDKCIFCNDIRNINSMSYCENILCAPYCVRYGRDYCCFEAGINEKYGAVYSFSSHKITLFHYDDVLYTVDNPQDLPCITPQNIKEKIDKLLVFV